MKFTSMFFTASAVYLRRLGKDTNKRAKNMKFTSMFFTASKVFLRRLWQKRPLRVDYE